MLAELQDKYLLTGLEWIVKYGCHLSDVRVRGACAGHNGYERRGGPAVTTLDTRLRSCGSNPGSRFTASNYIVSRQWLVSVPRYKVFGISRKIKVWTR